MELKELEYIVAVAEERSISKAADRLYLAQSSLSQFVSRYEAELGVKLFKRTSGGVRPTAAGGGSFSPVMASVSSRATPLP